MREQMRESKVGQREQMNQEEPPCLQFPQLSAHFGICLIRNLEEWKTHVRARKIKDFSDSDFILLAVIGQRI